MIMRTISCNILQQNGTKTRDFRYLFYLFEGSITIKKEKYNGNSSKNKF